MTNYLAIDEVMAIHETMIKKYGGRSDINDFAMLHSAIERCKVTFGSQDLYPSVFQKAAALIQSLILNHPFDDGNKRTAIATCARFLHMNNFKLQLIKKDAIKFTLNIDSHKINFEQTVIWLKKHSKKMIK